jgi:GTP-binding protein
MAEDEVIEITPKSIRLRKEILDSSARERAARTKSKQIRAQKDKK